MSKFIKLKNKQNLEHWLTVVTISIIASIINILHVIFGLARTPNGYTYLATGHYYLDYFLYLQAIARGLDGRWLPISFYNIEGGNLDLHLFPYIILGKIAWFFHLSPIAIYWLAVFFLTILLLIGFYWLINLVLKKEPFYLKIIAFLIAIISEPFYRFTFNNSQLNLNPYDFWYGPATFIRRFGVVPYHTLSVFLLVAIIIFINKIWENIVNRSFKEILINGLVVAVLLNILMIFSPVIILPFLPALLISSAIYFIKEKTQRSKIFLFNLVILLMVLPIGYLLRSSPGYRGFSFETQWIERVPWWFLLLNLGPMILLFPLGIIDYLKTKTFVGLILFILTLVSYGLFFSPLAAYLGTHNLRFFSPVSYIFFGVLTVFGLKKTASWFKTKKKLATIIISLLLISYSVIFDFDIIKQRLLGLDQRTPETKLTYVPSSIINHLKLIRRFPEEAVVLTGPQDEVGMLVPIFSNKRVYIGHPNATLDFNNKWQMANSFYSGTMTEDEAKVFTKSNRIGLVILTSLDRYDPKNLARYRFLKPIFADQMTKIWQVFL